MASGRKPRSVLLRQSRGHFPVSNRVFLPTFLRIRTWVYLLFWLPACFFLSIFSFPRVLCFPLCAVVVLLSINLPQALSCATTQPVFYGARDNDGEWRGGEEAIFVSWMSPSLPSLPYEKPRLPPNCAHHVQQPLDKEATDMDRD